MEYETVLPRECNFISYIFGWYQEWTSHLIIKVMRDSVEGMDLKITINHSNDFFKNLTENFCTGCGRRKVCWNYRDPSSMRENKGQEMGHYWKCNYGSLDGEGKKLKRRGEVCLVKELNINMIICLVVRSIFLNHCCLLKITLSYSYYSYSIPTHLDSTGMYVSII